MDPRVADLVAEGRRGDNNAFEQLVRPVYGPAERLASTMVSSPETARDLVQEAVLAAWLSLASLKMWMTSTCILCTSGRNL